MKNIILIHLESLSWALYHSHQKEMPNLRRVLGESCVFWKFFSSATSSIMAFNNLLSGSSTDMDHFSTFDGFKGTPADASLNLMKILEGAGYETFGAGCPVIWRDDLTNFNLWQSANPFVWHQQEADFHKMLTGCIHNKTGRPFALYVWDIRSHLAYTDERKNAGKNSLERLKIGYGCMDQTLGFVLDEVEKSGKGSETVVVGIGDHGDDFLTHGLNAGFCHSIEPYTNIIWTPMFIKAPSVPVKDEYALASLVDIKKTVLALAGVPCADQCPGEGIDLFAQKRAIAFAQNLFHRQPGGRYLSKAYSATNDQYHLILGEEGLEFYLYEEDPTNHNNLLHLFNGQVGSGGVFDPHGAFHPHFKNYFSKDTIADIGENFRALYTALQGWLAAKDEKAGVPEEFSAAQTRYKVRIRGYDWVTPLRFSERVRVWRSRVSQNILWLLSRAFQTLPATVKAPVRRIWRRVRNGGRR